MYAYTPTPYYQSFSPLIHVDRCSCTYTNCTASLVLITLMWRGVTVGTPFPCMGLWEDRRPVGTAGNPDPRKPHVGLPPPSRATATDEGCFGSKKNGDSEA